MHHKVAGQNHPLVKAVRRMARSGELSAAGLVLLETARLIEDARANGVGIEQVLLSGQLVERPRPHAVGERTRELPFFGRLQARK